MNINLQFYPVLMQNDYQKRKRKVLNDWEMINYAIDKIVIWHWYHFAQIQCNMIRSEGLLWYQMTVCKK